MESFELQLVVCEPKPSEKNSAEMQLVPNEPNLIQTNLLEKQLVPCKPNPIAPESSEMQIIPYDEAYQMPPNSSNMQLVLYRPNPIGKKLLNFYFWTYKLSSFHMTIVYVA